MCAQTQLAHSTAMCESINRTGNRSITTINKASRTSGTSIPRRSSNDGLNTALHPLVTFPAHGGGATTDATGADAGGGTCSGPLLSLSKTRRYARVPNVSMMSVSTHSVAERQTRGIERGPYGVGPAAGIARTQRRTRAVSSMVSYCVGRSLVNRQYYPLSTVDMTYM